VLRHIDHYVLKSSVSQTLRKKNIFRRSYYSTISDCSCFYLLFVSSMKPPCPLLQYCWSCVLGHLSKMLLFWSPNRETFTLQVMTLSVPEQA